MYRILPSDAPAPPAARAGASTRTEALMGRSRASRCSAAICFFSNSLRFLSSSARLAISLARASASCWAWPRHASAAVSWRASGLLPSCDMAKLTACKALCSVRSSCLCSTRSPLACSEKPTASRNSSAPDVFRTRAFTVSLPAGKVRNFSSGLRALAQILSRTFSEAAAFSGVLSSMRMPVRIAERSIASIRALCKWA
jgi:hypothetical protein